MKTAIHPTFIRDLLESAEDAVLRPEDFEVGELIEALITLANESRPHACRARNLASELREILEVTGGLL